MSKKRKGKKAVKRKWVSERQAEQVSGVPREILRVFADLPVLAPIDDEDRKVRRYVLLLHYCKLSGMDGCVMAFPDGEVGFHDNLMADLRSMSTGPKGGESGDQEARMQTLALAYLVSCPGIRRGPEPICGFLRLLAQDAKGGELTRKVIEEEWDRYEKWQANPEFYEVVK